MTITHFCGSMIIQAHNAFLNGAGSVKEGKENVGVPKTFQNDGFPHPYVSAQCWRRFWKTTFVENIVPNLASDPLESKYIDKPFLNAIDDIFGYFEASEQKIDIQDVNKVNVSQIRSSPFQISQLMPIQNFSTGSHIGILKDKAYVHLKDGTPLPYTSKFYYADLESMLAIDLNRVSRYTNFNDRQELSTDSIESYSADALITEISDNCYQLKDAEILRKKRVQFAIESLLVISGGAKSAQYGTDISPKAIIIAGMNGANPILSRLFVMGKDSPRIDIGRLSTVVSSNTDLFETPIILGVRQNYLENIDELISQRDELQSKTGASIEICSPMDVIQKIQEVFP